jgi:TRAP-type mannitol/chloroaromatic compound transport system permease small subunit
MERWLHGFSTFFDRLNERIGKGVAWLNIGLIILVCGDVFTRYLLNKTSPWVTELEWHLFSLIFLLGAGFAWKHDRHVRVDLFYARFSKRDRAMVDAIGALIFLLPWSLLMLVVSWKYAAASFAIRETSPDPGGLPAFYPIKFAICLGMLLLALQAAGQLYRDLKSWLGAAGEQ